MSRSKNRKIADLISGTTFDDGVVAASEVTGLATVATSGSFSDLSNQPTPFDPSTLGTASTQATGAFATAAQGTTANAALPKAGGAVTGNVTFGDNDKVVMGAGSDLQLYHDGSNSWIKDTGTGNLVLQSNDAGVHIQSTGNENIAQFNTDGAVKLYYDNAKKFETTASGIDVTGTVNADSLTGIGSIDAATATAITAAGVGGGEVVLLTNNGALSNTTYIEVSFTGDYRMYIVQFVNTRTNSTGLSAGYTNSSGNLITSTNYYISSTNSQTAGGSESMFFCGENGRPIDGFHFIHDPYSTSSFSAINSFLSRKQDKFYGFGIQQEDQNSAERHYSIKYWVGANTPSGVFTGGNYNVWGVTAP